MLKKYKKIKFLKGLVVCGFLTTYLVLSSTSINDTSIKQNQNIVYSNKQDKPFFNTYVDNSFYLNEVNYWHYDEPEAQVTRVNTLPILFKISTLNIIATPNTKNVKNLSLINNFKQITEYQTSENSGSYSYKSTKDEEIRVVDWQRILPQYLSFNIKRDNFDWGRGIANVVLDVKKTWNPESSVNLLDSNIVYVDDKVIDNTKHTFWFDKGFSKDLYNTKYHVWSLPYIYAKEIQFIYVAYNYTARYLYTLQTDNDFGKTTYDIPRQSEQLLQYDFINLFNLDQLFVIKSVDYNNQDLMFGFNDEIIYLANSIASFDIENFMNQIKDLEDFDYRYTTICSLIDRGMINNSNQDQFLQCKSCNEIINKALELSDTDPLYQLCKKYSFAYSMDTVKMINTLFDCLKLKLDYVVFDDLSQQYINQSTYLTSQQILNNEAKIHVNLDNNNQYYFDITNVQIQPDLEQYTYIAASDNEFDLTYSTDRIEQVDDHYIIKQPVFNEVRFIPELDKQLLLKLPSEVQKQDLVNTYIKFIDSQGQEVNVDPSQYYHIELIPNDLEGTLIVNASLNNGYHSSITYTNFNKFDYLKHLEIDVSALGYSLILDKNIDDEKIKEFMTLSSWPLYLISQYNIVNKNFDIENGVLTFNLKSINNLNSDIEEQTIKLYGFVKYYIHAKDNQKFLSSHKASEVSSDEIRNNLLEASAGYINKYGQNYSFGQEVNNDKLIITLPYDEQTITYSFEFKDNKNNLVYIICFSILGAGVITLVITLCIYFSKRKKVVVKNG